MSTWVVVEHRDGGCGVELATTTVLPGIGKVIAFGDDKRTIAFGDDKRTIAFGSWDEASIAAGKAADLYNCVCEVVRLDAVWGVQE